MATNITVRVNSDVKKAAEEVLHDLGMNITTAINVFLNQVIHSQGIPFTITRPHHPSAETLAAMEEAMLIARDPNTPSYKTMEELRKALDE